jgi:hypothetical protein
MHRISPHLGKGAMLLPCISFIIARKGALFEVAPDPARKVTRSRRNALTGTTGRGNKGKDICSRF